MYKTDGMRLVDGMAIAATVGMSLGTIYGSLIAIGPIAFGLIGMAAGAWAGYLLDKAIKKKNKRGKTAPGVKSL